MLNATCPVSIFSTYLQGLNATQLEATLEQQPLTSIGFASVLLLLSLFVLFVGAKLVKPTLFITAFMMTAIASFIVFDPIFNASHTVLSEGATCIVLTVAPLAIGLVAGCATLFLFSLGFALLGAAAGAGLGYLAYGAGLDAIPSPAVGAHDLTFILCLALGALVGLVVMCKLREKLLILATSFVGASGATPATALLLAHANINFLSVAPPHVDVLNVTGGDVHLNRAWMSPYVWIQPIFTLVLFALGLFVQCRNEKKAKQARVENANRNGLRPVTANSMNQSLLRP